MAQLSVPCRPGTSTYKFQVKTRSGACTYMPPRVLQHRILPPSLGGLRGCHVFSRFRTRLPAKVGSDITTCTMAPDSWGGLWSAACPTALDSASMQGGLWAAMCLAVPCVPWVTDIKKSLVGLPVRLGPRVPNTHGHVFKTPDVKAIMSLQDVRTGSYSTTTVQHRPC
jgi:hypothetical protein